MGRETERKYLLANDRWRADAAANGIDIVQGYLGRGEMSTVRVRIAGERAMLTIKGPLTGITRAEFEYDIPVADAKELLDLANGRIVTKKRYAIDVAGKLWVVDEFTGPNSGLCIAEIELEREDEEIVAPDWIGEEVSHRPEYSSSSLADRPYTLWNTKTD